MKEAFDAGIKREGKIRNFQVVALPILHRLFRYFHHVKALEYFSQAQRRHSKPEKISNRSRFEISRSLSNALANGMGQPGKTGSTEAI